MSKLAIGSTAGAIAVGVAAVAFLGTGAVSSKDSARADGPLPGERPAVRESDGNSVDRVTVVRPSVESFHRSTTQPAQVEPYERTDVYAKASGFLDQVLVDIGDGVTRGQILARLSIPEMDQERLQKASLVEEARAAVEQARSSVASADAVVVAAEAKLAVARAVIAQHDAEVAFRRGEHERIAQLVHRQSMTAAVEDEKLNQLRAAESALAVAHANVQSTEANVKVERARALEAQANLVHAEARLKVAQANLAHTEILIEYAQIRAPYDGIITRRWVDSGDFVTSAANSKSEPLFTVDRADKPLRIVFDVPENESSLIQLGQLAVLEVDALKGRSFDGRIKRTTGVLDPRTRTLRAEVELDGAESGLRPGLYGMITVTLAERPQALMVTTRCLRYENGQPFVFCAGKGVVEKRAVSVGYSDGIRTEIVDGIDASDLIVVESRSPIHPGDTVRVAMSE